MNDRDTVDTAAVWTFQRGQDRMTIRRQRAGDDWQLAVDDNGQARLFTFPDRDRLVRFQSDMETFLVRTGWSLAAFTPDRRRGTDRRDFPRDQNDRRRWWTDAPPPVKKPE